MAKLPSFWRAPVLEFFNSIGHKQRYCLSRFAPSGRSQSVGTSAAQGRRQAAARIKLSPVLFTSYDDIIELCCEALNKLVEQPWKIMSIGMRDSVHRF
jgi:putative transposase